MIKKIAGWLFSLFALIIVFSIVLYFLIYDSSAEFKEDFDSAKRLVRLYLYNHNYINDLSRKDVRFVYQKNCYRKCHGEAAMLTAVLSPAGWFQVVERMRRKENLKIAGREAGVIIKYLEEKYPSTTSRFSYEIRKEIHDAVWRHDMGQGDIYCDVIFATKEYLISIGADYLIKEYDLEHYYVFIVSFSIHDGEIDIFDLDKVISLNDSTNNLQTTPPWQLRFQTADKHHFEGLVRFKKDSEKSFITDNTKSFEFVVKNVGGPEKRVLKWDLPIKYPSGAFTEEDSTQ